MPFLPRRVAHLLVRYVRDRLILVTHTFKVLWLAFVLVRFDDFASIIVNANHSIIEQLLCVA